MAKNKYHPQIYSYLRKYQDDPTSRVFAPLAEAYRKAGLVDEAIEIAKDGLKHHPRFMGGRVALARALFDKKAYEKVVQELSPIMNDAPDNLVAQRLLAESHLMLGHIAESLSAFKMLLYFSPQDREAAKMVEELESQAYEKGVLILTSESSPIPGEEQGFNVQPAAAAINGDPDLIKARKIRTIEALQSLLQKVERYRVLQNLRKFEMSC